MFLIPLNINRLQKKERKKERGKKRNYNSEAKCRETKMFHERKF